MPAGRHDHYAAIQTRTATTDAGGNAVYTWATAASRWVSLEDTGGSELFRAQKVDATINAVIILRDEYASLTAEDRIVVDSRTFAIKAILGSSDRTAKRAQIVYCKEDLG